MNPIDDLIAHGLSVLAGMLPLLALVLGVWQSQGKRISRLEHLDRLRGRVIAGLLSELRDHVPAWTPSPELAADLAEMRRLEAMTDGAE